MTPDRARPTRRQLLWGGLGLVGIGLLTGCGPVSFPVGQTPRAPRVAFLAASTFATNKPRVEAFRQGLRELGYVEGDSIVVETHFADGSPERLRELAVELARLKVDLIVSAGPTVTAVLKDATSTIPIVMAFDDDPIGSGFVTSLARPGGNITGLSILAPVISAKQLELLREIVPGLTRVAVLGTSSRAGTAQALRELELAAKAFAVELHYLDVREAGDIEPAFEAASAWHAGGLLGLGSAVLNPLRTQVVELAVKHRLPTVFAQPEFVAVGGLLYYGASFTGVFRRAATYVDKILKGSRPAEVPIEQPSEFELAVNLKTAAALGLNIPQSVLLQATEVIQ